MQLLSDLTAGIGAADHQHRTGWQSLGVSILAGVQLENVRRQCCRERGRLGELERARRHDNVCRDVVGAIRRRHLKTIAIRRGIDCRDVHPIGQRRAEARRVLLEVADDLATRHEAVRIVAAIREAGQPDRPVGNHQGEGIPTRIAPGTRDLRALLQDHMRAALLRQKIADGQPCLSTADDHRLDPLNHLLTSANPRKPRRNAAPIPVRMEPSSTADACQQSDLTYPTASQRRSLSASRSIANLACVPPEGMKAAMQNDADQKG